METMRIEAGVDLSMPPTASLISCRSAAWGEGPGSPSPSRRMLSPPTTPLLPMRTCSLLPPHGMRPRARDDESAPEAPDVPPSWCVPRAPSSAQTLSDAIRRNKVSVIQSLLEDDPWVAQTPLPDTQAPPILAAVRCCSSTQLLTVLLRAGARADDIDSVGLTALQTISQVAPLEQTSSPELSPGKALQMPAWTEMCRIPGVEHRVCSTQASEEHCCGMAAVLLAAGADPDRRDSGGRDCAWHADRVGRRKLADLLRNWGGKEVAALHVLRQMSLVEGRRHGQVAGTHDLHQGGAGFLQLHYVFARVCEMLAPNIVLAGGGSALNEVCGREGV